MIVPTNDGTLVNHQHHIGDGVGGHHHGRRLVLNSGNVRTRSEGRPTLVHQVIWQHAMDGMHSTTTNQDDCHYHRHHHVVSHRFPRILFLLNATLSWLCPHRWQFHTMHPYHHHGK